MDLPQQKLNNTPPTMTDEAAQRKFMLELYEREKAKVLFMVLHEYLRCGYAVLKDLTRFRQLQVHDLVRNQLSFFSAEL